MSGTRPSVRTSAKAPSWADGKCSRTRIEAARSVRPLVTSHDQHNSPGRAE